MIVSRSVLAIAAFLPITCFGQVSTMDFSISGVYFLNEASVPVRENTLFQLINLGPDGIFNPVERDSWVGGDDVLIDLPFGAEPESVTAAAIDLAGGHSFENGFFTHAFSITPIAGVAAPGDKVGVRWYPGLTPNDYDANTPPAVGTAYGQVTLDAAINQPNDNTAWYLPETNILPVIFDPAVSNASASEFNLLPTPGFSGLPDQRTPGKPEWQRGNLTASQSVTLEGYILKQEIYEVSEATGTHKRLINLWYESDSELNELPAFWTASVAGRWIATIQDATSRNLVQEALTNAGYSAYTPYAFSPLLIVELASTSSLTLQLANDKFAELNANNTFTLSGQIQFYPDWIAFPCLSKGPRLTAEDPLYAEQEPLRSMGFEGAWFIAENGANTVTAIVDSGIDTDHTDLVENLWQNPLDVSNGSDDDGNGLVDDVMGYDFFTTGALPEDNTGHGTQMAGLIAAAANNEIGISGAAARNTQLMALKVGDDDFYLSRIIAAMDYARHQRNTHQVPVSGINLSSRWYAGSNELGATPFQLACNRVSAAGIAVIGAAGNDGLELTLPKSAVPIYTYPSHASNVITATAANTSDVLLNNANIGLGIDIAAIAEDCMTTTLGNQFIQVTGTSVAAAYTSAAIALARSYFPEISVSRLEALLLKSSVEMNSFHGTAATCGRLAINQYLSSIAFDKYRYERWGVDYTSKPESMPDANTNGVVNLIGFLGSHSSNIELDMKPFFEWQESRFVLKLNPKAVYYPGLIVENGNHLKALADIESIEATAFDYIGIGETDHLATYEIRVENLNRQFLRLKITDSDAESQP